MSYYCTKGLVEMNQQLLEQIAYCVEHMETCLIPVEFDSVMNEQYKIRRLLFATSLYVNECSGRFRGLKDAVKVGVKSPEPTDTKALITITPKRAWHPTVDEITARLSQLDKVPASSQASYLDFITPPANKDYVLAELKKRGWRVKSIVDKLWVVVRERSEALSTNGIGTGDSGEENQSYQDLIAEIKRIEAEEVEE